MMDGKCEQRVFKSSSHFTLVPVGFLFLNNCIKMIPLGMIEQRKPNRHFAFYDQRLTTSYFF